jgi:hypothetical protein
LFAENGFVGNEAGDGNEFLPIASGLGQKEK